MECTLAVLGLAVALFCSTNADDLLVLVAFYADPAMRARHIVAGQYAGLSALFAVSLLAPLLSLVLPSQYLGLLGFAPIGIGVYKLLVLRNPAHSPSRAATLHEPDHRQAAAVALATIANGADNIAVYMPTFAVHTGSQIALIAVVFIMMTALWCVLAHSMVRHPRLGSPIRRYAHIGTPIFLIGLGTAILYKANTIALFLHPSAHSFATMN